MSTDEEATKTSGRPLGETGDTVRDNIRRIRDERGVSGPELSKRLAILERPIPPLGIHRIETGKRRVDVDDLVAIAAALGVSPISLLMPVADKETTAVMITGEDHQLHAARVWGWLTAVDPLPSTPRQIEVVGPSLRYGMFGAFAWPQWIKEEEQRRNREHLEALLQGLEVSGGDD